jgi:hypothetical protein
MDLNRGKGFVLWSSRHWRLSYLAVALNMTASAYKVDAISLLRESKQMDHNNEHDTGKEHNKEHDIPILSWPFVQGDLVNHCPRTTITPP